MPKRLTPEEEAQRDRDNQHAITLALAECRVKDCLAECRRALEALRIAHQEWIELLRSQEPFADRVLREQAEVTALMLLSAGHGVN